MNIPGSLVDALIQPSAGLSKDIAEAVWEVTLDGSILENIPGISLILAFKEGIFAVRDRAFAAKVVRFLLGVSGMRASDRARVVNDLAGTADKRQKLGELLLDKLDRADPFHKPEMLAKLFIAVGRGHIAPSDFDRLSDMVINVFLGDLRQLALRQDVADIEDSRRFALQASGYLAWEVDQVYSGGGASLKWSITKDGYAILEHCPPGS